MATIQQHMFARPYTSSIHWIFCRVHKPVPYKRVRYWVFTPRHGLVRASQAWANSGHSKLLASQRGQPWQWRNCAWLLSERLSGPPPPETFRQRPGSTSSAESECTRCLHKDYNVFFSFNSFMHGLHIQDITISLDDATLFLLNPPHLIKWKLYSILSQYKMNFTHIDSWGGQAICKSDDTVTNGLGLETVKPIPFNGILSIISHTFTYCS